VPSFWASAVANLVFAGALLATAATGGLQKRRVCWVLLTLAVGALLQALMYLDAVAAFHGPLEDEMQPTKNRLQFAVALDAIAGVLVLITAFVALRTMGRAVSEG
jgi:hypothetical protein